MSNYEEELAIDPHMLDEECMKQAIYFDKYSKVAADLRFKVDRLFTDRKRKKSTLMVDAFSDPAILPGGKATAGPVEAYYRTHPDYQHIEDQYYDTKKELDIAETRVRSFSQKKDMLDKLVKLHGMSYFAVIKQDTNIKAGKRLDDKANDQVAQKSRRKVNRKRK